VLNTPPRRLGDVVRARVEARLAAGAPHPLAALRGALEAREIPRGAEAAAGFLALVTELAARAPESPADLLAAVVERTGYVAWLDGQDNAEERRANVSELVAAAAEFARLSPDPGLAAYLGEAALLTDVDRLEEGADRVLMLTAHNAKGLEFPAVIVAGLEEGLFPHASSQQRPAELEEERRLFYVAVTRARDEVLLTAAAFRHRYVAGGGFGAAGGQVSRFVEEIPEHLLERDQPIRARSSAAHDGDEDYEEAGDVPEAWRSAGRGGFKAAGSRGRTHRRGVGREVYHETFGRGVVVEAEGEGEEARYTVRFGTRIKKVLGRFLSEGSHVE